MIENNIIQSLWIGKSISAMERLCINSFLQNGHEFHLYVYQNIANLPNEVKVFDANQIIPQTQYFEDHLNLPASFSDLFRYKLLFEKGGWWVDMDTVCLKRFDIDEDYCFATEICTSSQGYCITNCVIKSPPKADFLFEILRYISSIDDYTDVQWGEFGPTLLKLILETYDSKPFIKLPIFFCPLMWTGIKSLLSADKPFYLSEESYAIHLFNTRWKVEGCDKNGVFAPTSLYEKLKRRYNVFN